VFEPVPDFAAELEKRFSSDEAVRVHAYGIGPNDEIRMLGVQGDATGVFGDGIRTATDFRSIEKLEGDLRGPLQLVIMNIEGGEYELLPLLSHGGWLSQCSAVLVQFHRVGRGYRKKRHHCQRILGQTHERIWNYDYVWELWKRVP